MKIVVFGIGTFIGGIIGCIGTFIASAINHGGNRANLFIAIEDDGLLIPFIFFAALIIIGLLIGLAGTNFGSSVKRKKEGFNKWMINDYSEKKT